ncbi:ABC transporter permease [Candidatus Marinimicrobia bacterium]|nr:ABC transporter permease [Candidatus Neomarinimicrobiota bacterium]
MKLVLFLIKKLFISKNSSLVFRLTNLVTIISLSLGVASLNIVMSSIDGFESEISKKLSNLNGYSSINHLFEDEIIQNEFDQPFILDKVPYLEKVALLKSKSDSQSIIINAYPINDFNKIRLFKSFDTNKIKNESIVVGKRLADNLNLKLGDQVVIFNPKKLENFSNQNRYDFFTVAHIYNSGIPEFDQRNIFTSLENLQEFYDIKNSISGWISIDPNDDIIDYPFYEMTIYDKYSSLFEWINTQKWPILFIFSLIAVVSFFGLLSSLSILFDEKKMDFTILKIYGLSHKSISKIFISQSMILASIGSTIGILLSYVIIQLQNEFKLISIEQNIYFVDYLPMEFNFSNSLLIIIISVILGFIISASSVKRFAYFNPMNVLRSK